MKQVPRLKAGKLQNPALIFTVALAMGLTILFDLTRIASIGAIFYLTMDIAIHWGLLRHLRKEVNFHPAVPIIAIVMDVAVLAAFIYIKYLSDPFVLVVALIGITLIIIAERLFMISHTDREGNMHMGMDDEEMKVKM